MACIEKMSLGPQPARGLDWRDFTSVDEPSRWNIRPASVLKTMTTDFNCLLIRLICSAFENNDPLLLPRR